MLRNYAEIMNFDISDSEVAAKAGTKQAVVDQLLRLMAKANLFSGSKQENQTRYNLFMTVVQDLAQNGVANVIKNHIEDHAEHDKSTVDLCNGHHIDNFFSTYQLLTNANKLTADVHDALMQALPGTTMLLGSIKSLLDKLWAMNKLNNVVMHRLFANLKNCFSLNFSLESYDASGEWMCYVLENVKSASEIDALANFLMPDDGGEIYEHANKWMLFDVFKVLVRNASQCQQVAPRLLCFCLKQKLFENADYETTLPQFLSNVFMLNKYDVPLNENHLALTLRMPEYPRAIAVCRETGFIQAPPCKENISEYEPLLTNMELLRALAVLNALWIKLNKPASILKYVTALFKIAREEARDSLIASNSRFFTNNRMTTFSPLSTKIQEILKECHVSADAPLRWKLGFEA